MKTWQIVGVCLGIVLAGAAQAAPESDDLGIAVQYAVPGLGDSDLYDWAVGAEAQFRYWLTDSFGWSLAAGWSQWEADSSGSQWGAPVDGSTQVIPLGGSVLFRTCGAPVRLVLEGGLRYAWVSSDLDLLIAGENESVDLDDGIYAVLGADLERDVSFGQVFVGVTFQLDVMAPEASWAEGDLRDASLEAATFRAGIRRKF